MKYDAEYFHWPHMLSGDEERMRAWVSVCMNERKNGASDEEIRRLVKRFRRMVSTFGAVSEASREANGPGPEGDFTAALQRLRVGAHG